MVNLMLSSWFQIHLEDENFSEALCLLDRARSDGKQLDIILFNTILAQACNKVLYLTHLYHYVSEVDKI